MQDGEAAGDQAAEVGASFISGCLAALEVAEGGEAAPEPLDATAAAAVRAELQAGLLAHAQGAEHGFCTCQSGSAGRRLSTSRHLGTCKVQDTESVLSIKKCRETLDHLPGTCTPLKQTSIPEPHRRRAGRCWRPGGGGGGLGALRGADGRAGRGVGGAAAPHPGAHRRQPPGRRLPVGCGIPCGLPSLMRGLYDTNSTVFS